MSDLGHRLSVAPAFHNPSRGVLQPSPFKRRAETDPDEREARFYVQRWFRARHPGLARTLAPTAAASIERGGSASSASCTTTSCSTSAIEFIRDQLDRDDALSINVVLGRADEL